MRCKEVQNGGENMPYKLLRYYKKELGVKNLILKFVRKRKLVLLFLLCISSPSILFFYKQSPFIITSLFMLTIFVLAFFLIKSANQEYKKVLIDRYSISSDRFWNRDAFRDLNIELIVDFLETQNINSERGIKHLISMVDDISKEVRAPFLVGGGVVIAMLIPVWARLIHFAYTEFITSFYEALFLFFSISLFALLIWVIYSMAKSMWDEIFSTDYLNYKILKGYLNDIYLRNYLDGPES